MSGMFESKSDKASRKLERTQKEEKARKKSRMITASVIIVFLLLTSVAIIINSGFIRRTLPVLTIDGVSFTTAEFEYFFNTEYMEYANFMYQFQGMGDSMPDANRPLSGQIYNPETGETWADMILNSTLERMINYTTLNNAAKAAGFVLQEERIEALEDDIAMLDMQAKMGGFPSTDSLLQQMFGSGMNEKIYRNMLEFISVAGSYNEYVRESFVYSAENLTGYYNENKDDLDVFNYRQFAVMFDELYPSDTHSIAMAIAEGISNEYDFITAAMEYNDVFYPEPGSTLRAVQGERLDADTAAWLIDENRDYGDVTVIETEQGSIVTFFVSRDNNDYHTLGMRQILITRAQINPEEYLYGEDDLEFNAALEQAEREVRERAELVNSLFIAAGETEDALIDLMADYSDDTTEGGLYMNITKYPYQSANLSTMKVVPEIEDWLFDENRAVGDSELVFTSAYGYHLLYFTGLGEPFFELIADDRMRTRDHDEWLVGLTRGVPEKLPGFLLVQM